MFRTLILAVVAMMLFACEALEEAIIDERLNPPAMRLLEDGDMHVMLCGTGTPLPSAERAGACTAIIANGAVILVDAGPGTIRKLGGFGINAAAISHIVITHFHSDHIAALGEAMTLSWVRGRDKPLEVWGPPGIDKIVAGFHQAYNHDREHRIAHHGAKYLSPSAWAMKPITFRLQPGQTHQLFTHNGIGVEAFNVNHEPVIPAVGYRFKYAGNSVVVSGDTDKSDNVERFAKGADLLVHEILSKRLVARVADYADTIDMARTAKLMRDTLDYHCDPEDVARIAQNAAVPKLLLTHFVPEPINFVVKRRILGGMDDIYDGEIIVGEDGTVVTLPAK